MKKYNFEEYFSTLAIPETWETLEEFCDWWMDQRMPWIIQIDSEVYITDNATSMIVFRQDRYQVELYLNHPNSTAPLHGHPGIELITIQIGRMNNIPWGNPGKKLKNGKQHVGNFVSDYGTIFLTFEKWSPGIRMTSAAIQWAGRTVGPIHDALILKHYPNAVVNGYADVAPHIPK